jgi:hypothetical protein
MFTRGIEIHIDLLPSSVLFVNMQNITITTKREVTIFNIKYSKIGRWGL